MESREYKIIQASTKCLFFRRCKCGGFTTPVIMNDFVQGQETFYCDSKCKKVITDLKTSYTLRLVVLDICRNKLESIIAYDKAAAEFIGCWPKEYLEANFIHKNLKICSVNKPLPQFIVFESRSIAKQKTGRTTSGHVLFSKIGKKRKGFI